jgi:hypothetical protein
VGGGVGGWGVGWVKHQVQEMVFLSNFTLVGHTSRVLRPHEGSKTGGRSGVQKRPSVSRRRGRDEEGVSEVTKYERPPRRCLVSTVTTADDLPGHSAGSCSAPVTLGHRQGRHRKGARFASLQAAALYFKSDSVSFSCADT